MKLVSLIREWFAGLARPTGNTVRTMFSLGTLAVLLTAALIAGTEASYIKLKTSTAMVEAGDRFQLEVFAFAHVPVNAVDITLSFDEDTVKVLGVDKGQSVLTIWTEEPLIKNGEVIMRGGTFRKGFIGEHKIATIELEAKAAGKSDLATGNVVLLAGDGRGSPVSVAQSDSSSASVYIYAQGTDPKTIEVAASVEILTDIDGDGKVTIKDISAFMGAWGSASKLYDFNGDGKMSIRDFSIILADAFLAQ
jgi:hypothetical protein